MLFIRKKTQINSQKELLDNRIRLIWWKRQASQEFEWLIGKDLSFSWGQTKESLLIAINDSMLLDVRHFCSRQLKYLLALWSRNKRHYLHPDIARASLNSCWRLQLAGILAQLCSPNTHQIQCYLILHWNRMKHQRKAYEMCKKSLFSLSVF